MVSSHERYVGDDAPSSRQIARLAAGCISFAKRHNTLRTHLSPTRAEKRYQVSPIVLTQKPELAEYDGELYRQYYAAILTQREQHQRELVYIRGYKVASFAVARSIRQISRFKWHSTTVERATTEFHFSDAPVPQTYDLDQEANNFSLDADAVDLLYTTMQLESINSADMDALLEEFQTVTQMVESRVDSYTTG